MEWVDQLKPFITWIHLHPGLAGVVTFFIAMCESLAVIGLIVPGSVIMSAIGTLVGADIIPAMATFGWAIAGAVAGDITSYHIGYQFTDKIPLIWPFRRYPHWLAKAQDFFARHGGKSVLFGRFIGPMRPIVPIVAGMMKMPALRFYSVSIIASAFWAPIYMLPGILIGAASQELAPAQATKFLVYVVAVLILLCLTMWLIKLLLDLFFRCIGYLVKQRWLAMQKRPYLAHFCNWLRDPAMPEHHSQLVLFLALILMTPLCIWAAYSILNQGLITHLNQPIHQLLLNIHTKIGSYFLIGIMLFSANSVVLTALLVGFIWLLFHRHWQIALHWLLGPLLIMGLVGLCNELIFSPRPSGLVEMVTGNSFPSTQTALSIVIYGFLGIVITRPMTIPLRRHCIYYSLISFCTLLIFSRFYLGIHWATDIIAGILCGGWVLLLVALSFRRHIIYTLNTKSFLIVLITTLLLAWGVKMVQGYRELVTNFTPLWPSYHLTENTWWAQTTSSQPLYRLSRIGKPVQIMNVQWLGGIKMISHSLEQQGWKIQPKQDIISTIANISTYDKERKTPLLEPLYLGQKPVLIATKTATGLKDILLLQLWRSNISLTDNPTPLWIGTIEYQSPHPHQFWQGNQYQNKFANLPPPIKELMSLNQQDQTKIVYYKPSHRPPTIPAYDWNGGVLFIRSQ
ncbi:MAG: phosphatase PAP2 family protein [Legionellales bacterium]|nr:phosphatase PAP2 family protein [Legionellales bacterium]